MAVRAALTPVGLEAGPALALAHPATAQQHKPAATQPTTLRISNQAYAGLEAELVDGLLASGALNDRDLWLELHVFGQKRDRRVGLRVASCWVRSALARHKTASLAE